MFNFPERVLAELKESKGKTFIMFEGRKSGDEFISKNINTILKDMIVSSPFMHCLLRHI